MSKTYFLMNKTLRKFVLIIGISFFSMILSTCSISDIADDLVESLRNEISGVVVDGYIRDAIVYLDCNKNFMRDAGENPVFTRKNGKYNFKDATEEEKKCPIVVDATDVDRVYDEDDVVYDENGVKTILSLRKAGREGFKLSAPAGKHEVISPLTHIANTVKLADESDIAKILQYMGIDPQDLRDAGISLTDFLYQDFLALADDETAGHIWSDLAEKARVMTRMLEFQQNKDGYTCLGNGCVENMKTVLGQFTNIYHSMTNEEIHEFTAEDMKERMKEMEGKHPIDEGVFDFNEEYHEDKASQENFLKSVMLRQTNEDAYCTADGKGSPDFRFLFTISIASASEIDGEITDGKNIVVYAPTAEMYYNAYTDYKQTAGDDEINKGLSCKEFFTYGKKERIGSLVALVDTANNLSKDNSVRYEGFVAEGEEVITLQKTINIVCPQNTEDCYPFSPIEENEDIEIRSSDAYKLIVTGDIEAEFIPYIDSLGEKLTEIFSPLNKEHHDDGSHM